MRKTFDEHRNELKPYGLTCEIWEPSIMKKQDRHNEIEINYIPEGSITYLFHGSKITIPAKRFAIFWGLVTHQIIDFSGTHPYYVLTIPLGLFLEWKLPKFFVDKVLKGDIIIENQGDYSKHDMYNLSNWINDYKHQKDAKIILLEIHARLLRLSDRISKKETVEPTKIHSSEISKVEQVALFIAHNYLNPIKAIDISKQVGLHPDYANVIFKKAFGTTINDYIIQERLSHAQRQLVSTDKSITDILYDSGFSSISRFNEAFRKANKCTPREFRKRFNY